MGRGTQGTEGGGGDGSGRPGGGGGGRRARLHLARADAHFVCEMLPQGERRRPHFLENHLQLLQVDSRDRPARDGELGSLLVGVLGRLRLLIVGSERTERPQGIIDALRAARVRGHSVSPRGTTGLSPPHQLAVPPSAGARAVGGLEMVVAAAARRQNPPRTSCTSWMSCSSASQG